MSDTPRARLERRLNEAGRIFLRCSAQQRERIAQRAQPVMPDAVPTVSVQPTEAELERLAEVLSWVRLIPDDRYVLRRIVASRMLLSPQTDKPLFPWKRLSVLLGANINAVRRWHDEALSLMLSRMPSGQPR